MPLPASIFKTRIQSKFDHISAWNENGSFVPLAGEIMVAYVPEMPLSFSPEEGTEGISAPPKQFLLKVGDGSTPLSDLQWVTAKAGDIWGWAKTQNLEWNLISTDNFLSGLSSYIEDHSQNATYELSLKYTYDELTALIEQKGSETTFQELLLVKTEKGQITVEGSTIVTPQIVPYGGPLETVPIYDEVSEISSSYTFIKYDRWDVYRTNEGTIGYDVTLYNAVNQSDNLTIVPLGMPTEGYVKSYQLMRNGMAIGVPIDIPKDFIVKDATVRIIQEYSELSGYAMNDLLIGTESIDSNFPNIYRVTDDIVPPTTWDEIRLLLAETPIQSRTEYDVSAGQKIIDLEINTISDDVPGIDHVYIPVKDLLGDELDATVSGDVASTDISSDFFNVVSGVTVVEDNGILESLSVRSAQLDKIALSGNAKYLTQDEGDYLILDCGSATVLTANPPSPEPPVETRTYMEFDDGTSQWFDFEGEINQQTMIDLSLFDNDETVWLKKPIMVTIGSGVTKIGAYAFGYCESLTEIIIPNSVSAIGSGAFDGCSLNEIELPNSVKTIEYGAFNYCIVLINVIIPNSVTTIEGHAFTNCNLLESLIIPKSVSIIGEDALDSSNLMSITMEGKYSYDVKEMDNFSWGLPLGCTIYCIDGPITI